MPSPNCKEPNLRVDFYTTWCGPCKKLDETTWKDKSVRKSMLFVW